MSVAIVFPSLIHRALFLTGPTASGKTSAAIELAQRIDAEIISMDSIAVYRGMEIGTAKPTSAERQQVPHHLLDVADPSEDFSITSYLQAVHPLVDSLHQQGRLPLFVGGTPLYLKALVRGFFAGPPPDWGFRHQVQADTERYGFAALHQRLSQVDPLSAHWLPPTDVRRITRALEVAHLTGTPLSHWQLQFENPLPRSQHRVFALWLDRQSLSERIERRVEAMFAAGLVEEVRALCCQGSSFPLGTTVSPLGTTASPLGTTASPLGPTASPLGPTASPLGRTASQAVGYRETLSMLRGEATLEETIAAVKLHTRQLSKRQLTWLRSLEEVTRLEIDQATPPAEIAARIAAQLPR